MLLHLNHLLFLNETFSITALLRLSRFFMLKPQYIIMIVDIRNSIVKCFLYDVFRNVSKNNWPTQNV